MALRDARGRFVRGGQRVTDTDRGAQAMRQRLRRLHRLSVRVGVIGDEAAEAKKLADGTQTEDTVADIASAHEFGVGVPRRSFIADYVDGASPDILRWLDREAQAVMAGGNPSVAMERVGLQIVGGIKQRIQAGIDPPLSEKRLEQKGEGKTTPLIDTGQLISSITHAVEEGARG
jgi:hypothetical protein